ncbi:MAG: hypothetical protein JRL30_01230 [Deltaproteobacteria bacterium]|nr:hypothetical protein [Deltaproteobacteria bacterium]
MFISGIDLVKSIVTFVATHAESESALLYSNPSHTVNAKAILDHLAEVSGVHKDVIGRWVVEAQEGE